METTTPPQATEKPEAPTLKQKLSSRLTDTIVLAVFSAGAYLCSFLYERGYAGYFGIPQEFINVSLVNLLIFGAGIVFLFWSIFLSVDLLFPFIRPKHPYLVHSAPFLTGVFIVGVILPFFVFGWMGIWFHLFFFGIWLLFTFLAIIWPLIAYRKSGSWAERYNKHIEQLAKEGKEEKEKIGFTDFKAFLGHRLGNSNLGFLIFVSLQLTFLIDAAGGIHASKQDKFLVTNTTPETVVLRVYGDNIICAPFNRKTHEVKKSFSIHKVGEDPKFVMSRETIGPLTPVEDFDSEEVAPPQIPAPTPVSLPSTTP